MNTGYNIQYFLFFVVKFSQHSYVKIGEKILVYIPTPSSVSTNTILLLQSATKCQRNCIWQLVIKYQETHAKYFSYVELLREEEMRYDLQRGKKQKLSYFVVKCITDRKISKWFPATINPITQAKFKGHCPKEFKIILLRL